MNTCPRCNQDLDEITSCMDCAFVRDEGEPEESEALDFNKEHERTYEPDFQEEG